MSAATRKQIASRWVLEMWGGGNTRLIEEFGSPNYVYRAPGMADVRGLGALKDLLGFYRTAFPDLSNTIQEQVAEGDSVFTRGTTHGTHKGPLGNIPASGNRIAVPWAMITRFDGDRIVDEWEIYDSLDFMQQIGAMPKST